MVNKKWNINVILCEECDKNIRNIRNIFDIINVDESNTASFDIVTIVSAIGCDEKQFGLYYFLEKLEKENSMLAFIGSSVHVKCEGGKGKGNVEGQITSVEGQTFMTSRIRVDECEFPGEGHYELKVYKFDDDEAKEVKSGDSETGSEFMKDSNLVTTYVFQVRNENRI